MRHSGPRCIRHSGTHLYASFRPTLHPSFRRTPESRIRTAGSIRHLTSRERKASGLPTVPSNLPNMIRPAPAHAATLDIGEAPPIAPLATSPAASPVTSVVGHAVCILLRSAANSEYRHSGERRNPVRSAPHPPLNEPRAQSERSSDRSEQSSKNDPTRARPHPSFRTTPLREDQQLKLDPYPSIAILAVSFPSRPWENDPHAEPSG